MLSTLLLSVVVAGAQPFGIHVVDDQTGRGVPLVELTTVNQIRLVTDSAGYAAFDEPGLMDQSVYFHVRSHGYSFKKDGFGNRGVALRTKPGEVAEVRLKRENIAERLYRLTGQGIYRDSTLLGRPTPLAAANLNGLVMGQDSVLTAEYRGRLYWFWGDTERVGYPLGHFRTAAATSTLPNSKSSNAAGPDGGGMSPDVGVDLNYFVDKNGFSRGVCPIAGPGPVWLDGLTVLPDVEASRDRLVAHYSRMESLAKRVEHGIVVWNDETEQFDKRVEFELKRSWPSPHGHPLRHDFDGESFLLFPRPGANVRVRADLASYCDAERYEAFTCLRKAVYADADKTDAGKLDVGSAEVDRDAEGRVRWTWQRNLPPLGPDDEQRLVKAGKLSLQEARFLPRDVESDKIVRMHASAVCRNAYSNQWIMIFVEAGGESSYLGEVWFAAADSPLGPWHKARKVVTHDRYSFYNPAWHEAFQREGGRFVYFEGTYTHTFSGNTDRTPRYDYNQIMYRLDLADPRLQESCE